MKSFWFLHGAVLKLIRNFFFLNASGSAHACAQNSFIDGYIDCVLPRHDADESSDQMLFGCF